VTSKHKLAAVAGVLGAVATVGLQAAPARAATITTWNTYLSMGPWSTGGFCLDSDGSSGDVYSGDRVMLFHCANGDAFQRWDVYDDGTIRPWLGPGLCLDANWSGSWGPGNNVSLWKCNGGANQKWNVNGDNTVTSAMNNGWCLDANGSQGYYNGDRIELWYCNGGGNQQWYM